jgi:hypothetical protein
LTSSFDCICRLSLRPQPLRLAFIILVRHVHRQSHYTASSHMSSASAAAYGRPAKQLSGFWAISMSINNLTLSHVCLTTTSTLQEESYSRSHTMFGHRCADLTYGGVFVHSQFRSQYPQRHFLRRRKRSRSALFLSPFNHAPIRKTNLEWEEHIPSLSIFTLIPIQFHKASPR